MGRTPKEHPLTMREKAFEWFARNVYQQKRQHRWRPRTKEAFEYHLGKLLPVFGELMVNELTEAKMQLFLNDLAQKSSRTIVEHCRMYLSSILKMAHSMGVVAVNEATELVMPETRAVERPYLSIEEFSKLLSELPTQRDRLMVQVLYLCALRRRELIGLKVRDFDGSTIKIERQISERDGYKEVPVKTRASNARVALPNGLASELAEWCAGKPADSYLFTGERKGGPVNSKNWLDDRLKPAAARAKIARIDFHMFRRGTATEQHQLGERDKNIQAQLRHASPDITRRVYMQTVPERQLEAARRLEEAVVKGRPAT